MSETELGKYTRTFKLDVTTKVIELAAEDPKRKAILVYNNGSAAVYILSAQNLTASDGIPVAAGSSYTNDSTTAALYIVAASGTQNVRVQVDGD